MVRGRHTLDLPDLETGDAPIVASVWHVGVGSEVSCGESVLEVLAGDAAIDLPAPVSGILIKRLEKRPNKLVLTSDNKDYEPICIDREETDNVRIIGKVIWSCREYR